MSDNPITLDDLGSAIINAKNLVTQTDILNIIPNQTSHLGKFLTTDGSTLSWDNVSILPDITLNSGKFLSTDGSILNWTNTLPDQTSNSGKFLTTDGTTSSWSVVLPSQTSNSGKFLKTDGTNLSWENNETIYRKIDCRSLSGSDLTIQEIDGTTTTISANGILWGARIFNYIIDNTLVKNRNFSAPDPMLLGYHNGQRGQTDMYNDTWYIGGYVTYQFIQSYAMRYNCWYFFRYYDTNEDMTMGIYGSNDKILWTQLKTFNINDPNAYTDGSQSVTETLGSSSITFEGRTTSDIGTAGTNPPGGVRRYSFENENYYVFYMLKWIGWGGTVANSATGSSINTQTEFEWG